MFKTEKIKKKYTDYMFDHKGARLALDYGIATLVTILSAFIYAFGFKAFLAPMFFSDVLQYQQRELQIRAGR